MFRVFFLALCAAPAAVSALAQTPPPVTEPDGPLSLEHAWALTLLHSPALKAYSYDIRAAEARQIQAALRPNPTLDIEVEDFGGSGELSGFDAAETTVFVSQPLELGHKREKRMQTAAIDRQLAGIDYEVRRREVRAGLAGAFTDLLAAQEKSRLYAEMADIAAQSLQAVQRRVAGGKDSPVEETRAAVEQSRMQVRYEQARRELETARRRLASFWAAEPPRFTEAAGELDRVEALPDAATLRGLLEQTPQWTRWETEIDRRRSVLRQEEAQATPDIAVGAGVKRFNEIDETALVVGLSIPLPLFDRNQGNRREAAVNVAKTFAEQDAAQLELLRELDRLTTELTGGRLKIESLQNTALPGAQEVLEASRRAYAEGKVDYLSVLDAQRTLFEARSDYVDSLAGWHRARVELEQLIGTQPDTNPEAEKE